MLENWAWLSPSAVESAGFGKLLLLAFGEVFVLLLLFLSVVDEAAAATDRFDLRGAIVGDLSFRSMQSRNGRDTSSSSILYCMCFSSVPLVQ